MNVRYISTQAQLSELIEFITSKPQENLVALDTEFERRTTFYPKPALLQLAFAHTIFLIDVVELPKLDALFEVLTHKLIVMHACREDMEVFRELSACRLSRIADTQVAAALLGYESQLSYQKLVESLTNKVLDKNETCSDWLQRPLSEEQIHYAADDVRYLIELFNFLYAQLKQKQREEWFWQDMDFVLEHIEEPLPQDYFERMKGLSKCSHAALYAAFDLILWREHLAREKNIPRGFLIKDNALLQIIRHYGAKAPASAKAFFQLEEVPAPFIKRYGDRVLALIQNSEATAEKQQAIEKLLQEPPVQAKAFAKVLKQKRTQLSEALNLNAEVLLSNRLLNALIDAVFLEARRENFSTILKPWRNDLFFETITSALK